MAERILLVTAPSSAQAGAYAPPESAPIPGDALVLQGSGRVALFGTVPNFGTTGADLYGVRREAQGNYGTPFEVASGGFGGVAFDPSAGIDTGGNLFVAVACAARRACRRSSAAKARDILDCQEFSHSACGRDAFYWMRRYDYIDGNCYRVAENISMGSGYRGDVRYTMSGWLHSDEHRPACCAHGSTTSESPSCAAATDATACVCGSCTLATAVDLSLAFRRGAV